MKHSSRAILLGIAAWSVAACGSDDPVAPPALTNPVAGIVLSASTDSLLVGATMTVDARALDSSGVLLPGVALSWRSLDAAVATVDGAGHVQTLTAGTARIVAAALGAADTLTVAALPPLAFASTLTIGPAWRDLALKSVALGDFTSCAITTDGAAWCSGSDGGQLGTGVVGTKPARRFRWAVATRSPRSPSPGTRAVA